MDRPDVKHAEGPLAGVRRGSILQVIYDGAQAALVEVTRVKAHAIECREGEIECKITVVSPRDLRFYAKLSPVRTSCLRPIQIREVSRV